MNKTVAATTLGCKVNAYDTESILTMFREAGYDVCDFSGDADVYIINTCTVTATSDKKSRQMIRRAAGRGGIVVVAGCFAQNKPDEAVSIEGVNIVAGVKERGEIVDLVEKYVSENGIIRRVTGYNREQGQLIFDNKPVKGLTGRTRCFVKIQDGCENFCSYCIIPKIRGPVRSRLLGDIEAEIRDAAALGVKEIVLTGISVASYGSGGNDLNGVTLADALYAAANIKGIERVRLSSVGPSAINDGFVKVFEKLPKLCGHIHLSLQAGCDKTLLNMNRKYTTGEYNRAVEAIRAVRPDAAVTTDVIVGFPGETDCDFEQSLDFVGRMGFADLHVFPFSKREGTAAAGFPHQIPKDVKKARAAGMIELGKNIRRRFLEKNLGKIVPVLFESKNKSGEYCGFSPNYIEVFKQSEEDIRGKIIPVELKPGQVY